MPEGPDDPHDDSSKLRRPAALKPVLCISPPSKFLRERAKNKQWQETRKLDQEELKIEGLAKQSVQSNLAGRTEYNDRDSSKIDPPTDPELGHAAPKLAHAGFAFSQADQCNGHARRHKAPD